MLDRYGWCALLNTPSREPDRLFSPTVSCIREVQLDRDVGRGPSRRLSVRSRNTNPDMNPTSVGIDPDRLLPSR